MKNEVNYIPIAPGWFK